LFLLAIALAWEIAARMHSNPNLPPFVEIIRTLIEQAGPMAKALAITLRRAGTGFAIALIVMLPLGVVLGRIRLLGDVVEPVLEFLRPLPPIAVVPLAMILLGIGDAAKMVVVVYGASFPILINTIDAVRAQDPMLARVARSLRLSAAERMALVDLPSALPRIVAGIRLSITVALLLTVVSEIILSTDGLGAYLLNAQFSFSVAKVLATLLVISVVAVIINTLTLLIVRRALAWHFRRSSMNAGTA
jgi:ABC-type nitrate/sulfonate/bicarbonate transport system permease component